MTESVRERGVTAALESEPDFETLYGLYHQFVRGALRKHYVDPSELEDMTQEVFLVLLRRVDEAAEKRSLGSWLYQVARRVAANYRRGQRRRVRKHGDLKAVGDFPDAARAPADPEDQLARQEAWAFVREFLESLDEEACAVFVMSEIEGLRGAEIASRLGLTLPMTYARIRNVRSRFGRQVARERQGVFAMLLGAIKKPAVALAAIAMAMSWRLKAGLAVVALAIIVLLVARGAGDPTDGPGPSLQGGEQPENGNQLASRTVDLDPDAIRRGPEANGVFGGVVVDPEGAPIAGAVVCCDRTQVPDHRLTDPPYCTTSDGQGRFEIRGALAEAHTLQAMAPGFVPGRFHGLPTGSARIVLHQGGVELSGVVLDVFGGPVQAAWVAVENRSEGTLGAMVRTDEAGAFSLWVKEGPVSLAAGATDYATSYTMALAPSEGARIQLGAESTIAGVVVGSETGKPVEGIRVGALLHEGPEKYSNRGGNAFSDAEGGWEIRGLQPGYYVLDAAGERSWGRARETVDLGIGDRLNGIQIDMFAGVDIVGRIVDADTGDACPEGIVITFDDAQSITREGRVHGDGLVAVQALTGGAMYKVAVSCRGYVEQEFDVDLRDGPSPPLEWPLSRGSELLVRVVDGAGKPLRDWEVELVMPPPRSLAGRRENTTTDAEGTVVFSGLAPGHYGVNTRGSGYPPIMGGVAKVGPEPAEVELRAGSGAPVAGTVVNAQGDPIPRALVTLQRASPPPGRSVIPARSEVDALLMGGPYRAVTDAAGRFRHASVPGGEYGVWVSTDRAAVAHLHPDRIHHAFWHVPGDPLRTLVVEDREITLELRVGELLSISGTVRDEEGDVLMDTRVFAARESQGKGPGSRRSFRAPRGRPRLTDREGRYRFDDVPPGTYSLTAYRPGGGVARSTGVKAGTAEADLVFPRLGRISGTVRRADGSAVQAYRVFTKGGTREHRPFLTVGSRDGSFVVGSLEAGRYEVRAVAPEGRVETTVELAPGEHHFGLELTLEARTHLKGRLIDGDNKPLSGWTVVAADRGAPREIGKQVRRKMVASDGSFVLKDLPVRELVIIAVPGMVQELYDRAPELRVVTPKRGETTDLGDVVVTEMPPF